MSVPYCERARIVRVQGPHREDHGILTTWVHLEYDGAGQGFGGQCLDPQLVDSYVTDLCAAFGVRAMDELVGKECWALRSFGRWGEDVIGLESADTGRRFLHRAWWRKHRPEAPSVLETRRDDLKATIASLKRDIARHEAELCELDAAFVDWEAARAGAHR